MRVFAFIFWIGTALLSAGQSPFSLISDVPCLGERITVDELGNVYVQTNTFIERWNAQSGKKYRNSELQWGAYNAIDVTDPLRPFIHFPGTGKIIFFDNTLSAQGSPIDLFERGFDQIEFVAGSRGDALWLWDARNLELLRVDQNFQVVTSTGNLTVLLGTSISPVQIIERGTYVYVRTTQNIVFVFDMYGTYKTKLTLDAGMDIQVVNNQIIAYNEKELMVIGVNSPERYSFQLPYSESYCFWMPDVLYTLHAGRLSMWKFLQNGKN